MIPFVTAELQALLGSALAHRAQSLTRRHDSSVMTHQTSHMSEVYSTGLRLSKPESKPYERNGLPTLRSKQLHEQCANKGTPPSSWQAYRHTQSQIRAPQPSTPYLPFRRLYSACQHLAPPLWDPDGPNPATITLARIGRQCTVHRHLVVPPIQCRFGPDLTSRDDTSRDHTRSS